MRYIISLLLTIPTTALAEVPDVVTDIPPVHSLAAAVMGDLGTPTLLLDRGASPHGFQLKPSQMQAVSDADLVLWMGPTLAPWLDKALATRPENSAALDLLAAPETYRQNFGTKDTHDHESEGHDGHDHAAEAESHDDYAHETEAHADHDDHEGHDDHAHETEAHADHDDHEGHDHAAETEGHDDHGDHAHTGLDPHAWLDPANGKAWAQLIAAELSRLDPENATTYAANAATTIAAIDAADQQATALLEPVKSRPFVTFHDAYGYFTAHYGLAHAGSIAAGDAASPGARHLTELQETVGADTTICLFPEAQHDPALLTQLAEATGAKTGGTLDPEGSSLDPGPTLYPALILGLAETMAACAN
jgi:zinc transport system substrate-binding protein